VDERLILANPLQRLKMARERRVRKPIVSLQEEDLILKSAPEHLRRMIIAALDTGMRRGEITNQLWEHIDLSSRLLYVTRSKTPEGESREIPLTDRLYEILLKESKPSGLAFTYNDGPVKILKTSWRGTLRRACVRHIRFHDLRHTFNTRLMEAGVLQEVRMALMGHSSGAKVHAIYTHIELPTKRSETKGEQDHASGQI
jgi:integrase